MWASEQVVELSINPRVLFPAEVAERSASAKLILPCARLREAFITTARQHEVAEAMAAIGFTQTKGRYFAHRNTDYFVESPRRPSPSATSRSERWRRRRRRAAR